MANLEFKPDYDNCLERVDAWYHHEVLDRVPVRFSAHNAEYEVSDATRTHASLKDRWFDTEYQVKKFEASLGNKPFLGETFPVFWPNLGPNVYPCMLGGEVVFEETTTWAQPTITDIENPAISFSTQNEYFRKLDEMTRYALERCEGKYIVGYTDIHSGADAADALRGTSDLLMDMYDEPEAVAALIAQCGAHFDFVFDYFHKLLQSKQQPSVAWMNIPSVEPMHIPSCDLSSMLSAEFFETFAMPSIQAEVRRAKRNVFHVDGKGVARHIDRLLELPEIDAYQWVQGMGDDTPILQWIPFIQKIQNHKKGVVVDLKPDELDAFMQAVDPKGIYLCIDVAEQTQQQEILEKLLRWK